MKKMIVIAIIAMLILSGCTGNQPAATPIPQMTPSPTPVVIVTTAPTATPNETATPEPTPTEAPTIQPVEDDAMFSLPQSVIDEGNISVVLEDVLDDDNQTVELIFSITNDTADDYTFSMNAVGINNVMMPFYPSQKSIPSEQGGLYAFSYSKYAMAEYGIEEIKDIKFSYNLSNTTEGTVNNGTFHLEGNEGSASVTIDTSSTLIASNEYINIYWGNAYQDSYGDEYYDVVVENISDTTLNLSMTAIAVNDVSIPSALNSIMLPNAVLLHRGYVSGAESSFLKDIGKAATVEIEFMGNDRLAGTDFFTLAESYVLDETIDLTPAEYTGQAIYNIDNMVIGINKVFDGNNACNQVEIYIANDKESPAYMTITDVLLEDGPIGSDYTIAVLPSTHATQIITLDDYLDEQEYRMSLSFELRFSYTAVPQQIGLTFTLE